MQAPGPGAPPYITFRHLKRLLTCQPYFVWHPRPTPLEVDNEAEEFSFWQIAFDDELPPSYAALVKSGYTKVAQFFVDYIQIQANQLGRKVLVINNHHPLSAWHQTRAALDDPAVDWIVNPVFISEDLLVKSTLYRKEVAQVSALVHSTKTKLNNYIQAYFETKVLDRLGVPLRNYSFFTYDNQSSYPVAPALKFSESIYCWTQKAGPSRTTKVSVAAQAGGPILPKVRSGRIVDARGPRAALGLPQAFEWYIDQIRAARTQTTRPLVISAADLTPWGENPHFNTLIPFAQLQLPPISGSLVKKRELLQLLHHEVDLATLARQKRSLKLILAATNVVDYVKLRVALQPFQTQVCTWYDFEGFAMPFVVLAHTKPHQQLVFQVSVIQTRAGQLGRSTNLVFDPQHLSHRDFQALVDAIYDPTTTYYVVYNQSYETTRLREIRDQILYHHLSPAEYQIYAHKINHIIDHTFDLLDWFKISGSKTALPPLVLHQLHGFSSIKKLEDLITQSQLELPVMIKPYKTLVVQNGLMAMNKAIQRYLGTIGDREWAALATDLRAYCENDVRAMIMVYHFVAWIVANETNSAWTTALRL